jgi:pimeloyl-ACP methyl ester carboxylesterase
MARAMTPNSVALESYSVVPTELLDVGDRRLAVRFTGTGRPLILCNRFRGTLDTWDPAFIDGLARYFRVITFDFTGLGSSSGEAPSHLLNMASDVRDLARALGIETTLLGGWSMGGLVAQAVLAEYPGLVSHLVLIGTAPPGKNAHAPEPIFFERAHKPVNDLDDETVLFFEPRSESSRRAAESSHARIALRTRDLSPPVPPSAWDGLHRAGAEFTADERGVRQLLEKTEVPVLVISGDHDIVFPVENWYDLTRRLPTAQLVVFPFAGHGPQHQYIDASVGYIERFVASTS